MTLKLETFAILFLLINLNLATLQFFKTVECMQTKSLDLLCTV